MKTKDKLKQNKQISKKENKKYYKLDLISFFFCIIFCLTCSSRDNKYYNYISYLPTYSLDKSNVSSPTKTKDTSSFPLEVSNFSYYNLKDNVDNSSSPPNTFTEELLNSFPYNYSNNSNQNELNIYTEIATNPWNSKQKFVFLGIYSPPITKEITPNEVNSKNIVFAVDTSGSMGGNDRIGLAKIYMKNLIKQLGERDAVTIVEYTDDASIALKPTSLQNRTKVLDSIAKLTPSGGTNAWPGILLAYKLINEIQSKNSANQIIILTDGDFGGVNDTEFLNLVDKENKKGISLSILGFGNDLENVRIMDLLAKSKKAQTSYIKSQQNLAKFSFDNLGISNKSIAENLKVEVKFNKDQVSSFRLIGFDNFSSKKDISNYDAYPGYSYIALYELNLTANQELEKDILEINLKYKSDKGKPVELKQTLKNKNTSAWEASDNFRFAVGITGLGMLINRTNLNNILDYNMVIHLLQSSISFDPDDTKKELLQLVVKLKNL